MTFMRRDVVRLGALDFILRLVLAGVIAPLTCPASEFHVTRSPTLNRFSITNLWSRFPLGAKAARSA
jgi:hypothetical protein